MASELTACFEVWRVIRAGNREVIEAVVAPEHRGPSAALSGALAAWPAAHYWGRPDRSELVLVRPLAPDRPERWVLHTSLFVLTVLCALGAGAAIAGHYHPALPHSVADIPRLGLTFFTDFPRLRPADLAAGWQFAVPLIGILLVHELGHYLAARRYAINVSPPYFLPIPATVSPIGSLGAFLKLRSPVVDRRQLLDVGAAGPLAGFALTLVVLAWGYSVSTGVTAEMPGTFIEFAGYRIALGNSLLTLGCQRLFLPDTAAVHLSPPAFAGWAGALITGLNLLPLSQLDGGHVAYGLLGRRQVPLALVVLLGLVYLAQFWMPWLFWAGLTLLIGGWRLSHPSVLCPERAIPAGRQGIGWLTGLVLVVTFVPIPFTG